VLLLHFHIDVAPTSDDYGMSLVLPKRDPLLVSLRPRA
jgi:hypothetical protein